MRKLTLGSVLGVILAPMAVATEAAPARAEIDPEALIERCWAAPHEDLHSDSVLRIGRGVSAVIDCLEYEIVRIVEASLECVPECGTAWNNVGAFELADRLAGVLRDLAAGRNEVAGTGLTAQEFIAAGRAKANEQTTVSVHLDNTPPRSVDSMVNSVIGALVMPCNPMWAEDCELPMEPLAQMLRDAGATLPAGGLPCDQATLRNLEACLPGFEVSPSPNGEQLYLTARRI